MIETRLTQRLYQLMADVLGVELSELSEQASPDTVPQWDSLNHLMLISALEAEFGVNIPIDAAIELRTVGGIRKWLNEQGIQD